MTACTDWVTAVSFDEEEEHKASLVGYTVRSAGAGNNTSDSSLGHWAGLGASNWGVDGGARRWDDQKSIRTQHFVCLVVVAPVDDPYCSSFGPVDAPGRLES